MTPEPWDYEAFVRAYDDIARERGGWRWDRSGPSDEKLKDWYETGWLWTSPADFARTRYELDQEM